MFPSVEQILTQPNAPDQVTARVLHAMPLGEGWHEAEHLWLFFLDLKNDAGHTIEQTHTAIAELGTDHFTPGEGLEDDPEDWDFFLVKVEGQTRLFSMRSDDSLDGEQEEDDEEQPKKDTAKMQKRMKDRDEAEKTEEQESSRKNDAKVRRIVNRGDSELMDERELDEPDDEPEPEEEVPPPTDD